MIKFRCPHCDQKLGVPDEYAGKRVRCNQCQQPCAVPKPVAPAASAQSEVVTMDEILSETSQSATVNLQSYKSAPSEEVLDDFDDLDQLEDDPRQKAIRLARENRNQAQAAKSQTSRGSSKKKTHAKKDEKS